MCRLKMGTQLGSLKIWYIKSNYNNVVFNNRGSKIKILFNSIYFNFIIIVFITYWSTCSRISEENKGTYFSTFKKEESFKRFMRSGKSVTTCTRANRRELWGNYHAKQLKNIQPQFIQCFSGDKTFHRSISRI